MIFQSLPHTHSSIVGVDVGGTFTDLIYFDGGAVRIYKLPYETPGGVRVRSRAPSIASPPSWRPPASAC
ncbi:MAG: hypothetical protein NT169_15360 [Chloroflexi bacterium]|nr:hypothetical protein [Chloroflexota bacterium]